MLEYFIEVSERLRYLDSEFNYYGYAEEEVEVEHKKLELVYEELKGELLSCVTH